MRPTLGRVVIYTRSMGEEFAARITRVLPKPISDADVDRRWKEIVTDDPTLDGLSKPDVRRLMEGEEINYEVFLAVDVHARLGGRTWYTESAISFDPAGGQHTWKWPERV